MDYCYHPHRPMIAAGAAQVGALRASLFGPQI
jgi:hypothetical protein